MFIKSLNLAGLFPLFPRQTHAQYRDPAQNQNDPADRRQAERLMEDDRADDGRRDRLDRGEDRSPARRHALEALRVEDIGQKACQQRHGQRPRDQPRLRGERPGDQAPAGQRRAAERAKAHSPATEGAAFDTPYCEGESGTFAITKDNIVDAGQVNCTLKNVKVTIKYDEKLAALLGDDVKVSVKVGSESLEFAKDETRSGFFHGQATNNAVDVVLTGEVEGENVSITRSYPDIVIGTELIVTYTLVEASTSVDPGTGGIVSVGRLALNAACEKVSIGGMIVPDEDEILDFGNPSVVGQGFNIDETVTDLTQPVVVLLNAPDGLAHVYVQIETTSGSFAAAVEEILSLSFDLAYPGDLAKNLEGLGLPVGEAVIGQQQVVFDVTQFVGLLANEAFAGVHTFNISVVDVNDVEAKAALTIDSRNAE